MSAKPKSGSLSRIGASRAGEYAAHEMPPLPNGMRVLFDPLPYVHSVCASVWIGTGSVNEDAQEAGITHFLEHLFFKGTSTRSARKLMEEIEGTGGHLNAFTSRDSMCLYVRVLEEHTSIGLEILADILKDSQFFDFEKERNVVMEEIVSVEDVPEDYCHDLLLMHLWPDHPLGRPVTGFLETVAQISPEMAHAYYRRWCRPENIIVSVAGNFSEVETYDQISEYFGTLGAAPLPPRPRAPLSQQGLAVIDRDIGQSHLCLAFPAPAAGDSHRYVAEMAASVLGGGSTSRLFDRIREQEGLAYSIYSFRSSYQIAGSLGIYAAVSPENLQKAVALIAEEISKLRENPVPEDEMELNREQIRGGILLAMESTSNRASHMARSVFYHGRILSPDEIVAEVQSVTNESLLQFAQDVFVQERCAAVVLGPQEGTAGLNLGL